VKLETLFSKPIARNIEGVIKAHDEQDLLTEVDEYVITDEVARQLERFLDVYNDYQGANGVWISGFFGSGKSHLLKMLALLLEDRALEGTRVSQRFAPKLDDNAMLRGQIEKAVSTPSQSILFNIDQKATLISKQQPDAVLGVFLKVFNAACGYFEEQPYIAEFERDLDERGLLDAFRTAYADVAGQPWERGREVAILEGPKVDRAYAQAAADALGAPKDILGQYRQDFKVSIESFARLVNAYIERQDGRFRLNFYVDEVGQYIADNVKLMTNLQSIAESLATQCRGRSWIIVTAQEDMTSVLGDMQPEEGDDFTKIQDRFKTRLKLTSRNVDEVIQKRLLLKTTDAQIALGEVYERQRHNLVTLFEFTGGSATYPTVRTQEEFVASYPFLTYQYPLFQQAIQDLSRHDAFEGKHSSVGERSMLGVFQQVAIAIKDQTLGALPSFDLMYEGIRATLKSQVQNAIQFAENHLHDPFAVQVLKALFLVKYIKQFSATPENIRVLMQSHLDQDVPALRQLVEAALNRLEQETYVQRQGEVYEFLTDEEKDVENEIKSLAVSNEEVLEQLRDVIAGDILRDPNHRYSETGQSYRFGRWIDDTQITPRSYDIRIRFISPLNDFADNLEALKSHAFGRNELTMVMEDVPRLTNDLVMYCKTSKYLRQTSQTDQSYAVRLILAEKGQQNQARRREIQTRTRQSVNQATILVRGQEAPIEVTNPRNPDPANRIAQGFDMLIQEVFPNLRMLPQNPYDVTNLPQILDQSQRRIDASQGLLSEAHTEVLNAIRSQSAQGLRPTMQFLVEKLQGPPYGWYLAAIQCIVAELYADGKIDIRANSEMLSDPAAIERALTDTHGWQGVNISPLIAFSARQIAELRDFLHTFFNQPQSTADARSLGQAAATQFGDLYRVLSEDTEIARGYPFAERLAEAAQTIADLANRSYDYYLTDLSAREDDLLDLKEQVIDPARQFLHNTKKSIYDQARRFLDRQEANLSVATANHVEQLRAVLADPDCHRGNSMQQAKTLMESIQSEIRGALQEAIAAARRVADDLRAQVDAYPDLQRLNKAQQDQVLRPLMAAVNRPQGTREPRKVAASARQPMSPRGPSRYRSTSSRWRAPTMLRPI